MKLGIKIHPEGDDSEFAFDLDLPEKYLNIVKEGAKVVAVVSEAVSKIKGELKNDSGDLKKE